MDSSTVLHWLRSSAKHLFFLKIRLKLIRETPKFECNYVATEEPAEIGSREWDLCSLDKSS